MRSGLSGLPPQQRPELVNLDFVLMPGDPDTEAREALGQMGFTVVLRNARQGISLRSKPKARAHIGYLFH
jgi:hypothetical protein